MKIIDPYAEVYRQKIGVCKNVQRVIIVLLDFKPDFFFNRYFSFDFTNVLNFLYRRNWFLICDNPSVYGTTVRTVVHSTKRPERLHAESINFPPTQ